jgi:hypothetical protein
MYITPKLAPYHGIHTRGAVYMSTFPNKNAILAAASISLLAGCIVQERVYGPPPQDYDPPQQEYSPPPREYSSAPPDTGYIEPETEIRVTQAPPPLPEYEQPACPEPGYLWTPGYWGYGGEGYYWVPGTWVLPPQVGVLWTPGYWGWSGGGFLFHTGYWGPHVGFYGGVNYGGGYVGVGFAGGRWVDNDFAYNTAVNNINTTIIHNTYNQTVVNNITVNKVSYNGGAGGVAAAPTANDQRAARERHIPPPPQQMRHINEASQNRALLATYNQGRPAIAATPRPAAFNAPNIVGARGAAPLPANRPMGGPESRSFNGVVTPPAVGTQASGRVFNGQRPSYNGAPVPGSSQAAPARQFNDSHPGYGYGAPGQPQMRGAQPPVQQPVHPPTNSSPYSQPMIQRGPAPAPQPQAPRFQPQAAPPQQQAPRVQPQVAPPQPQNPRAENKRREPDRENRSR